ncbi:carbon-nitrogen family hydrolase [Mesobacillus boroniphilus]|uniref:Carbon-nitrogen family hydrolase n=1 Tax=Mesobacillus boroniphilus TaxID=308892 RepID=A0A944CHF4_9BACI|nr:carbon-nitrogen family hydrolase [Mesobacillus boroniphilus]MBS8263220.1 carbon-nitrogen family hydrolase [Mesobacillus boroniphilus]
MKFKIACLQMDIAFGNPEQNYKKASELIDQANAQKHDIIVLPELWTTGYDLENLKNTADEKAQEAKVFLKDAAVKYNSHFIGGSVANKTEAGIENTLLVFDKNGEQAGIYSKLHLFKLMDEHLYLAAGKEKGLFSLEGHKFAGLICYDIRFPEWVRAHALHDVEAMFVVAEWPIQRLEHWRALLIARAIENQCFVIACNRAGSDPNNKFAGHSMVIGPWGDVIAEGGEEEEILLAEIDLEEVKEARGKIPIFADRRPELY